ncbi:MAG TPA: preprotein translocase subunit SecG [Patescibacteria group bacterium]|nr:preprotein translocase subunit SecG [Patescibacteria group bacterium]
MFGFLVFFICLLGLLLILAVMIQPGKGGMGSGFGGAGGELTNMFGTRRTADFLVKSTIGLAITIFLLTLATNKFLLPHGENERTPVTTGVQVPMPSAVPLPSQQPTPSPTQQNQPQTQAPAQTPTTTP